MTREPEELLGAEEEGRMKYAVVFVGDGTVSSPCYPVLRRLPMKKNERPIVASGEIDEMLDLRIKMSRDLKKARASLKRELKKLRRISPAPAFLKYYQSMTDKLQRSLDKVLKGDMPDESFWAQKRRKE